MAIDKKAYALANGYTDETVIGGGAIKGKNCTISKIEDIDGGHRITFGWTLDNGTTKSQTLDVKDGADGYTPVKGVDYFDGQNGEQGIAGIDGKDGTTYTPSIGEVTTVESNIEASATVSVNTETKEAVFNFAIPKGKDGDRNADTVNNHTVKSDVPENAVFTDTIYDDTEIKDSITEINSNLLGFDTIISSSTQTIEEKDGSYVVNLGYFPRSNGKKTYKYYSLHISVDDGEILFQKTYANFEMSREKVVSTWNQIGSSKSLDIAFNTWDKNNTITIYNFRNADYTIWQPTKVICAVLAW